MLQLIGKVNSVESLSVVIECTWGDIGEEEPARELGAESIDAGPTFPTAHLS